ncbi:hypothetical protein OEW28_08685 [Defluviimonas sp. WL0002]|uniref:Uncharacterized protein n=1 Tax=Albidovulum marisflavi TaxID=2984159 RepID=A0ABT2ZC30_9RHOB|nr:hypothetical protein [Defluviimonas sp. WL0002]MCV2868703.1 hypothetical protein [Defluviimonas sp. WL0002]
MKKRLARFPLNSRRRSRFAPAAPCTLDHRKKGDSPMPRHTPRLTSGLLPHQIAAFGAQVPGEEKAFRAANATYRAIRFLELALSLRWLGPLRSRRGSSRTLGAMKKNVL